MNTGGYGGQIIKKRIRVKTNDRVNDELYLEVTGSVEAVVEISPDSVSFIGKSGDEFEQVVTVTPSEKYPFNIRDISLKSDLYVTAQLQQPEEGDHTWKVIVKNIMKTPGRYFEIVTLKTDSEMKPEIKIRVYAMINNE